MSESRYIYGRHPVLEQLRRRPRDVQRLYVMSGSRSGLGAALAAAQHHGVQVVEVNRRKLQDLVGDVPHQGVVAQVVAFNYASLEDMLALANQRDEAPLLLVLDQIQDPHNLGSIVRSAYALGAHGVLIPKDRACEVTPTVVKTSAGATAHQPIGRVVNLRRTLEDLKEAGLWVIGTVAEGGRPLEEVDFIQPTVLVIGSEGKGLRPLVAKTCDLLAQIPMPGHLGSLNASVAAGIALYEAGRQRRASCA